MTLKMDAKGRHEDDKEFQKIFFSFWQNISTRKKINIIQKGKS